MGTGHRRDVDLETLFNTLTSPAYLGGPSPVQMSILNAAKTNEHSNSAVAAQFGLPTIPLTIQPAKVTIGTVLEFLSIDESHRGFYSIVPPQTRL
jgi:hypothetical protein